MLDIFEKLTHNSFNNTFGKVSWCIDGDMMLFQCSKEIEDWENNFDIFPALLFINGKLIITTRGWKKVWSEIKQVIDLFPEVKSFGGYSCGCIPAQFASVSQAAGTVAQFGIRYTAVVDLYGLSQSVLPTIRSLKI